MTITGMEFLICSDDLEWRDQTESGEKGERGKGKLLCLRLCLEAVCFEAVCLEAVCLEAVCLEAVCLEAVQLWLCSGGCAVVAV